MDIAYRNLMVVLAVLLALAVTVSRDRKLESASAKSARSWMVWPLPGNFFHQSIGPGVSHMLDSFSLQHRGFIFRIRGEEKPKEP